MPSSSLRRSSRHHASTTAADREREVAHKDTKTNDKEKVTPPQLRKRKVEFAPPAKETAKKARNTTPVSMVKKIPETTKSPSKLNNTKKKKSEPPSEDEHIEPAVQAIQKPESKLATTIAEAIVAANNSKNRIELEAEQRKESQPGKKAEHEMTVKEVIAKHMRNSRVQFGYGKDIIRLADKAVPPSSSCIVDSSVRNGVRPVTVNDTLAVLFPERKESPTEIARPETPNPNPTTNPTTSDQTVHDENGMWGGICQLPSEFENLPDEEFNVEGQRYVRLTSLLNEEGFTVPVTIPVKIQIPRVQGVVYMCLADAFKANYIPVKRRSLARWVYMILKAANLLVHKAFSDLLYDYSNLFNIKLTRGMDKPLEDLPFVALERCDENTVAYINGFDLSKEYQYKPRVLIQNKNSSQSNANVSSIADVQYLSKYIKKIEEASFEEAESSQTCSQGQRKTPSPEANQSRTNNGIRLTQRVLICSGFDAGSKEIDLAIAYGLPLNKIKEITTSYAANIRELTNFLQANKELYPGTYVGLNIMMWRFFRDCRNKKLNLDETRLKEHSRRIALQLGLINFRATDDWMDAFKKRHTIDLLTMRGEPVTYVEDGEAVVCLIEPQCDQPSPDDECSACPSPHLEAARPIDIINMSLERHELISAGEDFIAHSQPTHIHYPGPSSEVSEPQVELELIKSLVRSTAMHCPDKEIASALDTIRCFILHKDPKLLIPFTDLQTKIFHSAIKKEPPANDSKEKNFIENLSTEFIDI